MSAAPSQIHVQPSPVHRLQPDFTTPATPTTTTTTITTTSTTLLSDHNKAQDHALLLHHHCNDLGLVGSGTGISRPFGGDPSYISSSTSSSSPPTNTTTNTNSNTAYSQDHQIPRDSSLTSFPQQDYYGPSLEFNLQQQPVSSSRLADNPIHQSTPAPSSIPHHLPGFGGNGSSRGRSSMEGSDLDSPPSQPHSNPLEDTQSDEFGLTLNGPRDGSDLGFKRKEDKTDSTPAWSELKTKAGKERKRLPLACIACRRKKIRCSGEKPGCKHCVRSKVPCVYKVTARKAAPRTDYMTMLDKRLKRMEERIIKIVPKTEQENITPTVPRANVKPAIPGTLGSGKGSRKRGAEEAFGNAPDLDSWAKAPTTTNLESPSKPNTFNESEERQLLQEGLESLPPKEIQEHLAGVFFENVYGQAYHILHQPSYMRKLRAGTLPPVLVLSVCAVSARFSRHPKLNSEPAFWRGDEWADVAREIVTKRYEWPNITVLTCLLLLGLHEFGTCHGGRSWALGGQAIRMAFALQLHKDLDYDPQKPGVQLTFVDREIRRRTMWACFMMDRFNSSGTDRPTFIKEEALKIPLPVQEKNFQFGMPAPTENLQGEVPDAQYLEDGEQGSAKDNMGVAAYMIKTISIWGRIIMHLNQGGKETDAKLLWDEDSEYSRLIKEAEDMATSLPESLVYNPGNVSLHETDGTVNQFMFLHIAIQQNILFLSRLAVSPDLKVQQNVPTAFVTKAGARAFASANRISELLKDSEAYSTVNAPFLGYCAFLSSTVHIFGNFSGNKTIEANSKQHLGTNIKFFQKMKRVWGFFNFILDTLRVQFRDCTDGHRNGGLSDLSSTPIFQYGDWFDRYPNGLSESDWIDPAYLKKKEKGEDAVLEQKPELHTVEEFFTALSPDTRDVSGRSNSMSLKRKASIAAKRRTSMSAREHHGQQLQTLMTELSPEQIARLQQHQQGNRYPGATLGGQTSGATTYSGLNTVQHANAYGSTISPISPVNVGHNQFAGHQQHHGMYNDMLGLQLAQQNMLQTHAMLGGQFGTPPGIDPTTAAAALMDSLPGWSNGDHGGSAGENPRGGNGVPPHNAGSDASHGNPHHTVYGHGHDPSNSWFNMAAFGLDAPEVGDVGGLGGGMEFGSMFGNAAGNTGRAPGGH